MRNGSASSASPGEEIESHLCIETPKGADNPEKGAIRKVSRCKGYKTSYNEKGTAIYCITKLRITVRHVSSFVIRNI